MANQKKALSIVFVETNGLVICSSLNPAGASFPFPAGMIATMEVVKPDDFHAFIASICTAQQLNAKDILFVFGNSLLFQKQTPLLSEEKTAEEVKNFQQLVPFDWVATKIYKTPTGNSIIAINRDFFDVLKQSFERGSARILAVIPQFIFAQWVGKQPLTQKTLESLFTKSESIAEQSVVTMKSAPRTLQEQEEYLSKRYSGPLIVVFILFLLAVFGITGYILQRQSQSARSPAVVQNVTTQPTDVVSSPIATPTPTPVPESAQIASSSAVRITIAYGQSQASVSAKLRQALSQKGFTQVTLQAQSNVTVEKPIMIVRPTVSGSLKTQIIDILQPLIPDFSSQENTELESDVWITLGN